MQTSKLYRLVMIAGLLISSLTSVFARESRVMPTTRHCGSDWIAAGKAARERCRTR